MRMGKFSTMMLLQHLLFPKFAPELTHRPVLSRQRSSRHVTAEQANAWHLIEQLSSEDDVDRQMLQALRPRLEEAEHWDAVAKAHSESLQAGEAKSARVVKLVQHASQLVCRTRPAVVTQNADVRLCAGRLQGCGEHACGRPAIRS